MYLSIIFNIIQETLLIILTSQLTRLITRRASDKKYFYVYWILDDLDDLK